MAHVTLGEAARQTGRSKSQISRAIRAGQLSAERSAETASFRIEQSELQRWLDATNVIRATVLAGVEENPATGAQHAALEAQVERFKEAADLLRSQLVDALSERDEWREAFKQQRALPPPQPAGETPQRWWRWLALTTLLAIVVTAAIVAATVLAISFALAERPADTVDRLAEPALTGFYEAGAPGRGAHLARTERRGGARNPHGPKRTTPRWPNILAGRRWVRHWALIFSWQGIDRFGDIGVTAERHAKSPREARAVKLGV